MRLHNVHCMYKEGLVIVLSHVDHIALYGSLLDNEFYIKIEQIFLDMQ